MNNTKPVVKKTTLNELLAEGGLDANSKQIQDYLNSLKAMGIATQLTPEETYYFLKYCFTLNLNPLLREIHCVKMGNTMTPIVSYYEYVKRAEKNPLYQLPELTWVMEDKNGKPLPLAQQYIIASIQRKGETTKFTKIFYMAEWNKQQGEWLKKPRHMLEVRAVKNLLAVAFPNEVAAFETPLEYGEAQLTMKPTPVVANNTKQVASIMEDENE